MPRALITNMILTEDTIVVCGLVTDSIWPYQQGIIFSRLDTLGQIIDAKVHIDNTGKNYALGSIPGGFIRLEDQSGYIMLAALFETATGLILKLTPGGAIEWIKEYPDNNTLVDFFKTIVEVEDGFLISGRKQMLDGNTQIFLLKTDKEGNKIWESTYGLSTRNDDATNLLKINDNEFVIGGSHGNGLNLPWQQAHSHIQIFAVDSLGNEKWYWESDPPFDEWSIEDSGCYGLHCTDEGNWVYATTRGEFQGGSTLWRQAKFVVRDSNFNLIAERTYDDVDGQINEVYNVVELSDGDWLKLGINTEWEDMPGGSGQAYAWMTRISNGQDGITSLGDSLWMRLDLTFPDSTFVMRNYLHSAVELSSGSIIAAGYFSNNSPNQADHGLLIKVNQHGCIDWDDCVVTNFPNAAPQPPEGGGQPAVQVFPNPTRDRLHIQSDEVPVWDRVEVLDMRGQVIKTEKHNTTITLSGFPSGVYVLRLWKDGQFWVRRIVRQ